VDSSNRLLQTPLAADVFRAAVDILSLV